MATGRYAGVKINISNIEVGSAFNITSISKTSECEATNGFIYSNSTSLKRLATCTFVGNDCVFPEGYYANEIGTILRLATRSDAWNWDSRGTDVTATDFPTVSGTKIKWIDGFIDNGFTIDDDGRKWLTYNIAHCVNSLWGEEIPNDT